MESFLKIGLYFIGGLFTLAAILFLYGFILRTFFPKYQKKLVDKVNQKNKEREVETKRKEQEKLQKIQDNQDKYNLEYLKESSLGKTESPLGLVYRYNQIGSRVTDKVQFDNFSKHEYLKIGFLHDCGANYLCFESYKKDIPFTIGSHFVFGSDDGDLLSLEIEEKPYEFKRYKNKVIYETKVLITHSEYLFFCNENINSITYKDKKDNLTRVYGFNRITEYCVDSYYLFNNLFSNFFNSVQELIGKDLVFPEIKEPKKLNKDRSRHISQSVKDKVWNRDNGKCIQCESNSDLEFDHIIPWSKGGANTYRNIQLLCQKCNREKSDKL